MKTLIPKLLMPTLMLFAGLLEVGAYHGQGMIGDPPTKHTVKIFRMKFIPAHLTVKKGDIVEWVNKDFYPHDVTDEKNKAWTSGPFGQNGTWSMTVTEDEAYFCNLHKVMKGTITVE